MNTVQRYFRVDPKNMAYVKFVVESYGGLAVLTTLDARQGLMAWMISPQRVQEAEKLIASLQKEVTLEPIDYSVTGRFSGEPPGSTL